MDLESVSESDSDSQLQSWLVVANEKQTGIDHVTFWEVWCSTPDHSHKLLEQNVFAIYRHQKPNCIFYWCKWTSRVLWKTITSHTDNQRIPIASVRWVAISQAGSFIISHKGMRTFWKWCTWRRTEVGSVDPVVPSPLVECRRWRYCLWPCLAHHSIQWFPIDNDLLRELYE